MIVEVLSIGGNGLGWALHADIDVEGDGRDDTKEEEDDRTDDKSLLFRH